MQASRTAITGFILRLASRGAAALVTLTAAPTIAGEANPYAMANNTWITISGSVESVSKDTFMLDYGDGLITVEMDDGDRDADAYMLAAGDKVTVSGKIDDEVFLNVDVGDRVKVRGDNDHDLFDGREIEADYIVKLHSS